MSDKLLIMIYHRVLPEPDLLQPEYPTADGFDRHMRLLRRYFRPISLADGFKGMQDNSLPARAVAVTFDDGYADNYEVALPLLKKHNIPATVFVSTGFLNGGMMWNDRVIEIIRGYAGDEFDFETVGLGSMSLSDAAAKAKAVDQVLEQLKYLALKERLLAVDRLTTAIGSNVDGQLMMTDEQVIGLHQAGVAIGAHTVNHPILQSVALGDARQEIVQSRNYLENLLDTAITHFAYPNGRPHQDYSAEHVAVLPELGFDLAVSTAWGCATSHSDPYQLPRVSPWGSPALLGPRLLKSFFDTNADQVTRSAA